MEDENREKPHIYWSFCESNRSNPRKIGTPLGYTPLILNKHWDHWDQWGRGRVNCPDFGNLSRLAADSGDSPAETFPAFAIILVSPAEWT